VSQNWGYSGGPPVLGGSDGSQTLVAGSLFCVSASNGDIPEQGAFGLFFRDLRALSRWELRVDGLSPQGLAAYRVEPARATYVGRVPPPPGRADSHLLVLRDRVLGDGMREKVVIRNLGQETAGCSIALLLDADFADVFEVKENRVVPHPERITGVTAADGAGVVYAYRWLGHNRDVHVRSEAAAARAVGVLTFAAAIPPGEQWQTVVEVSFAVDEVAVEPRFPPRAVPASTWVFDGPGDEAQAPPPGPELETPYLPLSEAFATSVGDLRALRLHDPGHPEREVVAAGAPWFMTVFGRDSLLTAWMTLPFHPELTRGTLHTLAHRQGTAVDPLTEEEPGRILHEMRFGTQAGLALGGGNTYYGTADATPLFVMLLGEAVEWGLPHEDLQVLLPHADAALEWMQTYGDKDRDGFLEYRRATDQGLVNQGWKDSFDGISYAGGSLASAPLALCEVQAYAYGAYRARSRLADLCGDRTVAARWAGEALRLKEAFNTHFWLPDRGYFALALDRDHRPVDALTSNIGHCLWTGIVDDDKAASVVAHLTSPDMMSGWGVRTLARTMGAYNPLSYHNGSIWPHDNALVVAGLRRYGFVAEAQVVVRALLEASAAFGSRLPELFSGFDRADFPGPVPYPTSCSPQAWSAATPFLLLRSLLGLEPHVPDGTLTVRPELPEVFLPLTLSDVRVGTDRLRLSVDGDGWRVEGLYSDASSLTVT
jgi:glycogen debranching enzyme